MAISWDWWNKEMEKGKNFGDFRQPFSTQGEKTKDPRKRLIQKYKKYGLKKTAKWLLFDFLSAVTFGLIKSRPIQEDKPELPQNINEPEDKSQKKIIRVEEPEEDSDVATKKYTDEKFTGTFTGTFTEHTGKTVTVSEGLIISVA